MKNIIKSVISFVLVLVLIVPCVFSVSVKAVSTAKIHSLIPKVEQYYSGIEDYIADAVRNKKTSIDVTSFRITPNNIPKVFKSAVFTNPDIFYVDASYIDYRFDRSTNIVHYIYPHYIVSKSKIPAYIKRFNSAVNKFMKEIDNDLSDMKKALLIHDMMIDSCQYKSGSDLTYTAYGVLVNKKAVCEGYARAYCYLLSKAGIESKCINNESKAHCWNYVKLDGYWYHVDVTSDDPTPDTCGYVLHKYFLINDARLSSYKSSEHTGYKSDLTYKSAYKCSNNKYNSSFFRNIKSRILYFNNAYYFINNNYNGKHYSAFIRRKGSSKKVIKLIQDKWYSAAGKKFKGSYSKLTYLNGFIYFNSKRSIYRYKISSGKTKRVFNMPSFWGKDFYGVSTSGRYIIANKKKSETSTAAKSKILYIRANNSVFQLPFIKKSSVKIKVKNTYKFTVYRGTGKVKYKSSNKRIAKVNSKGVIKALRKGSCVITAGKNSKKFKIKVKVYK